MQYALKKPEAIFYKRSVIMKEKQDGCVFSLVLRQLCHLFYQLGVVCVCLVVCLVGRKNLTRPFEDASSVVSWMGKG